MKIPDLRVFVEEDGFLVIARGDDGRWQSLNEGSRASWTDEAAADAIPLIPQGDVIAVTRAPGGVWNLYVNGDLICGSLSRDLVADDAIDYARRLGGRVTLLYDDADSIEARRERKLNPG